MASALSSKFFQRPGAFLVETWGLCEHCDKRRGSGAGRQSNWTYQVRSSPEVSQLLSLALVRQLSLKVEHFDVTAGPSQLLDLLDTPDGPVYGPVVTCGKHDAPRTLSDWLPIQRKAGADEGSLSLAGGVLLEIVQGASAHAIDALGVNSEPFLVVVFELVRVDLGIGLLLGASSLVLLGGLLVCEDRPREESVYGLCEARV